MRDTLRSLRDRARRIWNDPGEYSFPGQAYATKGDWMLPLRALNGRWVWGVRRLTCLCGHTTRKFDPLRLRIDLFVCPSCGCHYSAKVEDDTAYHAPPQSVERIVLRFENDAFEDETLVDVAPMTTMQGRRRDDDKEGE